MTGPITAKRCGFKIRFEGDGLFAECTAKSAPVARAMIRKVEFLRDARPDLDFQSLIRLAVDELENAARFRQHKTRARSW